MKTKEQLQAEIIEKYKKLVQNFKDWTKLMSIDDHEGARELSIMAANIESELSALESEGEEETCWNCKQREGEECGITGKEVYEDTPKCSQYSQK